TTLFRSSTVFGPRGPPVSKAAATGPVPAAHSSVDLPNVHIPPEYAVDAAQITANSAEAGLFRGERRVGVGRTPPPRPLQGRPPPPVTRRPAARPCPSRPATSRSNRANHRRRPDRPLPRARRPPHRGPRARPSTGRRL